MARLGTKRLAVQESVVSRDLRAYTSSKGGSRAEFGNKQANIEYLLALATFPGWIL
jgi:hypothetical protein